MKKKIMSVLLVAVFAFAVMAPISNVQASSIKISKKVITLQKKKSYTLKLTGTKKKVKWYSSKKKVATVNKKGKITAKNKSGTAYIVGKVGNKKYKCKVNVRSYSSIKSNLHTINSWSTNKIWNDGFCDIYWYEEDGTDSIGNDMNINKKVSTLNYNLKKKGTYNAYINSLVGSKYTKIKSRWKPLYSKYVSLQNRMNNSTPVANSTSSSDYNIFDLVYNFGNTIPY